MTSQSGYSPLFEEAVAFAVTAHRHQRRKGKQVPYVTHLFAVASLVGETGGSETEVIAALLHDVIEDQGAEYREKIAARFGDEVLAIVEELSDNDQPDQRPPWKARKEAHLRHLETASLSALRVLVADKLHNTRGMVRDLPEAGPDYWQRFNGGRDGTLWYLYSILKILRRRRDFHSPLVSEYAAVLAELEWACEKLEEKQSDLSTQTMPPS